MSHKKVAIVCDWLIGGGAEMVVLELHKLYPDAPIYASCCSDEWRQKLDNKVKTGYLQSWPFFKLRKFLPVLRQRWFSKLKLDEFELVFSSTGAEAKGINVSQNTKHVSYIHAPTHYYWSRYEQYLKQPGFGLLNPLARLGLKLLVGPMRKWDYKAAHKPDVLIANSNFTKMEIKKYYHRDSVVVHPPVDTEFFKAERPLTVRTGFIVVGRQTPYKRFDLAIKACSEAGLPLTVVGKGPDHSRLQKLADLNINFVTEANRQMVADLMQEAAAFIFPGVDDFGIVAVEAMAAGCPIIAYKAGGALDYVNDKTGVFFESPTVESLKKALLTFSPVKFSKADLVNQADKFSVANFRKNIASLIN